MTSIHTIIIEVVYKLENKEVLQSFNNVVITSTDLDIYDDLW